VKTGLDRAEPRDGEALPVSRPSSPDPFVVFERSPVMRMVMARARAAAASRRGVLLTGEPGTGREAVARAIHAHGGSPDAPFVKVDCAECSPPALERGLFGAELKRAHRSVRGEPRHLGRDSVLLKASGGTLLLFNLEEMPARLQLSLAHVLSDQEVSQEDGSLTPLDIRLVGVVDSHVVSGRLTASLHRDLQARLAQMPIEVPSLRMRCEDIPDLALHFLLEVRARQGGGPSQLSRPAQALLSALPWRGNARELRALVECVASVVQRPIIQVADILRHVRLDGGLAPIDRARTLREARHRFEREFISTVLAAHDGRVGDAARALGIQRTNLYRKVRHLNVARPQKGSL
jgi:two-component system response regulator GlrR